MLSDAIVARFWSKVDKSGECWLFDAPVNPHSGHPAFGIGGGKSVNASRAAWMIAFGEPGDLSVLHHCDNGKCVRPEHLHLGTLAQNTAEMDERGRRGRGWTYPDRRGERYHTAKLTDAQVEQLKADASAGESLRSVGRRFGVSHTHVSDLVTGRRRAGAPRQRRTC